MTEQSGPFYAAGSSPRAPRFGRRLLPGHGFAEGHGPICVAECFERRIGGRAGSGQKGRVRCAIWDSLQ
jgi:hypothetical protein